MSWLEITLTCVLAAIVCAALAAWLFKKDTEVENRRRSAAKLAGVLRSLGLKKIPDFLECYAVGDYSGMAYAIKELVKLFLEGEDAVVGEFGAVFEGVLAAKLKSETGRAYIAAKLEDACKDTDPDIVIDAPKAAAI